MGLAEESAGPAPWADEVGPFLQNYCFDCHGGSASEGGIDLETLLERPADRSAHDAWRKVMQQVQLGLMPPRDHAPRPATEEGARFVQQVDQYFFRVDCNQPRDPGRVTVRRFNRVEYENTIRDLLGIEFYAAETFPRDDVGYGFDNIGDVLSVSPTLMEKYLEAAETISQEVIYVGPRGGLTRRAFAARQLSGNQSAGATIENDYLLVNRDGYAFLNIAPHVAGEYEVRIVAFGVQAGDEPVRMGLRLRGKMVMETTLRENRQRQEVVTRVKFGEGDFPLGPQEVQIVYLNDFNAGGEADRDLGIVSVEVAGPLHMRAEEMPLPPAHRNVIRVEPSAQVTVADAARENLLALARRAYRRPVDAEDIAGILELVNATVAAGESFEQAMRYGLQAILVSPQFLFRVERAARPDDPQHVESVAPYELASRLSYFLWSTMPDEELFRCAADGSLAQRDTLIGQVDRMLRSDRANALAEHFPGQWLNLRNLEDVRPNRQLFPDFNERLAWAMRRETELLFQTIMRENRSVLELISADYTFVNESLAEHYGIDEVEAGEEEFERVSLAHLPRRGVLTHASILTLTSDPGRTLPVKRGKWILEVILGDAPPPPPPNVPPLEETAEAHPNLTLREQLERHRQDGNCAVCHRTMDPLGLAFEHYDAIGRYRDLYAADRPIDASGALPDGSQFQDALELIGLLQRRDKDYIERLTRAMLTYALGRGLEAYDQCAVESITRVLAQEKYPFHTLIREVVLSEPFQLRRGDGGKP